MNEPFQKTAVLKFGGEVVARRFEAVLREVAELVVGGWCFVVCHGGGTQSSELGLEATKVAGQRVTDEEALRVVCRVLASEVSCTVVAAAQAAGLRALGISAGLIAVSRRPPVAVASEHGRLVDYGLVGDVVGVDRGVISGLWAAGLTPVVNPIGVGARPGEPALYNINADTVALAIARELGADHLFAITGVPGVLRDRDDPGTRLPRLAPADARAAIAEGGDRRRHDPQGRGGPRGPGSSRGGPHPRRRARGPTRRGPQARQPRDRIGTRAHRACSCAARSRGFGHAGAPRPAAKRDKMTGQVQGEPPLARRSGRTRVAGRTRTSLSSSRAAG